MKSLREISRSLSLHVGAGAAQFVIYGIALLIMVLGIRKVATMGLSESELLFGIILVLILSMQTVIMGTIVGFRSSNR